MISKRTCIGWLPILIFTMIPAVVILCTGNTRDATVKFLYKPLEVAEILIRLILVDIASGSLVEIIGTRRCYQCTGKKQKLGES